MRDQIPFAVTNPAHEGLDYLAVEVSCGDTWVNINDGERYKVNAEQTRDGSQKQWRRTTTTSVVLGGDYLIHAVPEMITETIGVWVYGTDQTDLADNLFFVQDLFEQFDYRIRWTTNEYREYWHCQLADTTTSRGHVMTHSVMAMAAFQIKRYPDVERERIA